MIIYVYNYSISPEIPCRYPKVSKKHWTVDPIRIDQDINGHRDLPKKNTDPK